MYTNEGPNRIYISTSFEEYKKLSPENMYFTRHGDGRLYWKQLTPKTVIGCSTMEITNSYGRAKEADPYIMEYIMCSYPDFEYTIKRLNRLDVEWTFETVDESDELKKFLDSTYCHLIHRFNKNAEEEFRKVYGVKLKSAALNEYQKDLDVYESYINRHVRTYHVFGIDTNTNQMNMHIVQWNDYNSIKFIEDNFNEFIKIADYVVLDY